MKKNRLVGIVLIISLIFMTGCTEVLPKKVQVEVNKKADEVKSKALEELQKALTSQIQEFMKNTDLKKTLGLTDEENEKVESSLKEYLENYDKDPAVVNEAIDKFTDKINELKESGAFDGLNSEELSKELNKKLQEILDK